MTSETTHSNIYLHGPLGILFLKTAAPIVLVMLVNGLFTIVDAYFLGRYVGAEAVVAVTLMFPLYMMLVALSTLVSNGFSSIYARANGANDQTTAPEVFSSALQLSLIVCLILIGLFATFGTNLSMSVSNGDRILAELGHSYMAILIYCSPVLFVLSINIDALRGEGLLAAMGIITLASAVLNIVFDWLFIVVIPWGVEGSAVGSVLAQVCSIAAVLVYRSMRQCGPKLHFRLLPGYWRELLALGAPTSLGYIGISLMAAITLYSLQAWATDSYTATSGAYGILTRVLTFFYLPLLGLSLAFQTIVGNNYGARLTLRTHAAVRIVQIVALIYCGTAQIALWVLAPDLGAVFVDDQGIQAELARILPLTTVTLFMAGSLMMVATYYQAIGNAKLAALLGLAKVYLFALPLLFALPFAVGEIGIWISGPIADLMLLSLTLTVLWRARRTYAVS